LRSRTIAAPFVVSGDIAASATVTAAAGAAPASSAIMLATRTAMA
jgi:hypothetical protein